VIAPLFEYLQSKYIDKLTAPADWRETNQNSLVFSCKWKVDRFTLGHADRLLRHPERAIDDCFGRLRLNRAEIYDVLRRIKDQRNPAAHGGSIAPGEAEGLRRDWFHWRGRPGGIFSVLFSID
jgi:hypothetical protein